MRTILKFITVMVFSGYISVSQASVIFVFSEVGSDLVGNLSGTLDLTGATVSQPASNSNFDAFLRSNEAFLVAGPGANAEFIGYSVSGATSFGSSDTILASYTGDLFTLDGLFGDLRLSTSFLGGALSGTMTLANTAISDLGLTGNNFIYSLSNGETVTISFVSQVSAPATLAIFGLSLAGLGWSRRKKA
jgi:hypothetical protein